MCSERAKQGQEPSFYLQHDNRSELSVGYTSPSTMREETVKDEHGDSGAVRSKQPGLLSYPMEDTQPTETPCLYRNLLT